MTGMVFIIDDDANIRESVLSLLAAEGMNARAFTNGDDFFDAKRPDVPSCLICDLKMPGLGGLEIASELARRGAEMPIIFVTGSGTIPMSVQAMKARAMQFLTKPVDPDDLLDAVSNALEADASSLHAPRARAIDEDRKCD